MNKILVGSLLLACLLGITFSKENKVDWDIYHTGDQIAEEMENLRDNCGNRLQLTNVGSDPSLKVARLNAGQTRENKAFLVFGEHPRELISSETGLRLLQKLCQNESQQTDDILDNYEIAMILNANPKSRQGVENGDLCLRENQNGVDINRNYDAHWEKIKDDEKQTTSGDSAQSEPETISVSNALRSFKPDMFLSIHSGALGLYTPHAYTQDQAEENEVSMLDILSEVALDHCSECSIGAAGQKVGYLSSGTSLDFAYDTLGVQYSYVFEIFDQSLDLRKKYDEDGYEEEFVQVLSQQSNQQKGFLGQQDSREEAQKAILNRNRKGKSCMLETSATTEEVTGYNQCFRFFNPEDKEYYEFNVENWSEAIMDLMQLTGKDRQAKLSKQN